MTGSVYKVLSPKAKTVSVVKAKNVKSYTISSTIKIAGETYKVTQVEAKAFKGSKVTKVIVGKNVKVLKPNCICRIKSNKSDSKDKESEEIDD